MASVQICIMMGQQIANNMVNNPQNNNNQEVNRHNFCPNCGTKLG